MRNTITQTNPRLDAQPSIPFWKSLRGRLFLLAIGTAVIAALMLSALAINLGYAISHQAEFTSSQSLREQAEAYLVQLNTTIASQNDLILDRAARDVRTAAEAAAAIYAGNLPSGYWPADEHLFQGPEGQFLNGPEDTSSVFVPNTTSLNSLVSRDIELSAYLDLALQPIFNNNPNAAAIYFGSIHNVTRYFPNIELGKLVPPDFQVTKRPWFTACVQGNPDPTQPSPVWSPVYLDATGLGLVTTVAFPVFTPSASLAGVVGLDLTLNEISKNIQASSLLQAGYSFLIDQNGLAIILPEQGYHHLLGRPPEPDEFATDLSHLDSPFATVIHQMLQGNAGFQSVSTPDGELFVAFAPLPSTHWALASVVPANVVLQSVATLRNDLSNTTRMLMWTRVLPISVLIAFVLFALGLLWSNRLVVPLRNLAEAASQIGAGRLDIQVPVRGEDEIGLLGRTFSSMQSQLSRSFQELEARVAERTHLLERRSLQLQTAAEVAREITNVQNLEQLLWQAVNLISDRFEFYNVGIFLVDETREEAILVSASGEIGRRLTEEGIKLRVGEEGMVGYVTRYGHARIASDVLKDSTFVPHPLLPETRSEITLPLSIGDRIIGALDVQSSSVSAFDAQDASVLQTLADQLAIAIENARLVEQLRQALQETSEFYRQQARQAWMHVDELEMPNAYEYDRIRVKPVKDLQVQFQNTEQARDHRLVVPLQLRQETIGYLAIESDEPEHQWTEDEIAIAQATANQVAMTLENARLLIETQRRAAMEQFTSEVSMNIRQTLDMETILRTAIDEIQKVLGVPEVRISLAQPQPPTLDNPELNG